MKTEVNKNLYLDDVGALFNLLFGGSGERVLVVDNTGKILNTYNTTEEFIAVPPAFNSPGIPGQKAWDAPNLWYCVAPSVWVRFPSESAAVAYADLFTAIPATLASAGVPGQFAYDAVNNLVYLAVAANTWVKFSSIPEEFTQMYVAVPPASNSPGSQGQRAYDAGASLLYECVALNTWIRYPITNSW